MTRDKYPETDFNAQSKYSVPDDMTNEPNQEPSNQADPLPLISTTGSPGQSISTNSISSGFGQNSLPGSGNGFGLGKLSSTPRDDEVGDDSASRIFKSMDDIRLSEGLNSKDGVLCAANLKDDQVASIKKGACPSNLQNEDPSNLVIPRVGSGNPWAPFKIPSTKKWPYNCPTGTHASCCVGQPVFAPVWHRKVQSRSNVYQDVHDCRSCGCFNSKAWNVYG